MVSSIFGGGDSGGGNPALLMQNATPMPNLPVAGKDSPVIDPHEYGTFQNFLPEPLAEGVNPMATGLRPEMLNYKPPSGVTDPEIKALRDKLAATVAAKPVEEGYVPKMLPGGGLDPSDPGNVARYNELMRGGGR
jgi:hypothetical protein